MFSHTNAVTYAFVSVGNKISLCEIHRSICIIYWHRLLRVTHILCTHSGKNNTRPIWQTKVWIISTVFFFFLGGGWVNARYDSLIITAKGTKIIRKHTSTSPPFNAVSVPCRSKVFCRTPYSIWICSPPPYREGYWTSSWRVIVVWKNHWERATTLRVTAC